MVISTVIPSLLVWCMKLSICLRNDARTKILEKPSHPAYSCGYGEEYQVLISYFPNSMQGGWRAVDCGEVGTVSALLLTILAGVAGPLSPLLSASTAWLEGKHSSGLLAGAGDDAAAVEAAGAKAMGPIHTPGMQLAAKLYPHQSTTQKQPTTNQYTTQQ